MLHLGNSGLLFLTLILMVCGNLKKSKFVVFNVFAMVSEKKPSIAAIIPVYNASKHISGTIKSLLSQTRKFDEIIIVDDGSTDNTLEVAMAFPVKVFRTNHAERSAARNFGAKKAKSNIIAFIESDAVYSKNWVKEALLGFSKGFPAVIDRRKVLEPKSFIARMNDALFEMRYKNYSPFNAWVFNKKKFLEIGGFDEGLNCAEDKDLGDRFLARGWKIYFASKAVHYHEGEPRNLSQAFKRSVWFGSNIGNYWKKKPEEIHYFKLFSFGILPFLLVFPLAFLAWAVLLLAYVFLKDLENGLDAKFLPAHALYVFFTEFVFVWSYFFSLAGFRQEKVR